MKHWKESDKRSRIDYDKKRDRYLFLMENLIENVFAFFFDAEMYYYSLKEYVSLQIKNRTRFFLTGVILLFFSLYFILFFLTFFFIFAYEFLLEYLKNSILSAFLLAWIAFLFFFITVYLSFHYFYKTGRKLNISKRGKE